MAKGDRKGNQGGAHAPEQTNSIEQPPEGPTGSQEPHDDGAAEVPLAAAAEASQDGPRAENFEQQSLAELKAGKAADMKLRADLERQLAEVKDREARRDAVFAPRFIQEAAAKKIANPILEIDGTKLIPRAKKGGAGGFVTFRDRAPLDI